jgi:hypothetical protein
MVTDAQVRLLRQKRMEKKTLEAAAAAAGMSERTARTWQHGELPSETKRRRGWRTRTDPFSVVWEGEVVPLLRTDERGVLEGKTVLAWLQERHPGQFGDGLLRTMQRRLRDWRALSGPGREVFFEQRHVPGREAAIDFTDATELGVTIRGQLLEHLLFEYVLSYSTWTWVDLAYGETFEALSAGIQGAMWALGAVTEVLRSDNLSAATHELRQAGGRTLTVRYQALLDHYGMTSTRIRPGESHENGGVEQRHYRTKSAVAQALVIRGSKDFDSTADYLAFVRATLEPHNRRVEPRLAEERAALRRLPAAPVPTYTRFEASVRRWSTIRIGGRTYSVPSRLIGHEVVVHRHPDTVEVFYGGRLVESMPRLRGERDARIDYRHVIWSLVRKPGAFARYKYREELFPTLAFRRAYDALCSATWRADVEYLRLLHLAASTMQAPVEQAIVELLDAGAKPYFEAVRDRVSPVRPEVPLVAIPAPDLTAYDRLLGGAS